MKRGALTTLAAAAAALVAQAGITPAGATTISSNGSTITGLNVGGTSYDVSLVGDQSCSALFAECGASTNNSFTFTTQQEANAASFALREFLMQTSLPGTIGGCTIANNSPCFILTPYAASSGGADAAGVIGQYLSRGDEFMGPSKFRFVAGSANQFQVYAIYTPAKAVPEPASLALLAAGTLGTALVRRKRPRRSRAIGLNK